MSMQARLSEGDRRLYSVNRDIAHNFKAVISLVMKRFDSDAWPELTAMLAREKVSMAEVDRALSSYCSYVASGATDPKLPMVEALRDSKFLDCHPAAQVAVMAMLGTAYAGIQFAGAREATVGGEGPLMSLSDLLQHARKFQRYAGMSRIRRKLVAWRAKLKSMLERD